MTASNGELQDGRADFDFIIGQWNIHHRRLRERLKGSTSWEEFEGTAVDRKILGGLGSISEVTLQRASGPLEGMTVRIFDPKSGQSDITTTSCHWEQAFSEDGGSTWETNWMMELNRQQE